MTTSTHTESEAVAQLKDQHRALWAAGSYADVAETIADAAPARLIALAQIEPGHAVLDVGTGTGNVALRAAELGAEVTGLDLVPDLLAIARARSDRSIAWIEGDAEALPFADASFDRVLSVVGTQFAPRHQVVADELVRVCRSDGAIGLVNWTPEGLIGRMFKILGSYMPAPPAWASPPPLWGSEEHQRSLFAAHDVSLSFERGVNPFRFPSLDEYMTALRADHQGEGASRGRGQLGAVPRRAARGLRGAQPRHGRHAAHRRRVPRHDRAALKPGQAPAGGTASSSRSRRAVAEPERGSIVTMSTASASKGFSSYDRRAMPILLLFSRLPVPPAPTVPALITVAPGRRVSSAWWVWPTRMVNGFVRPSASSSSSASGSSAGLWTMTRSTWSRTPRIQVVKRSTSEASGVRSKRSASSRRRGARTGRRSPRPAGRRP
jgi:SAM-dependent methyltransferase